MEFQLHRPQGYIGAGDRYLPKIVRDLQRFLTGAQDKLAYATLRLPAKELGDLAQVLVEFAEDIHNGIGLWRSLEQYQLEFFNTPLPLFLRPHEKMDPQRLNEYRLRHLLWVLYPELKPDLILAPDHQDLHRLAARVAGFLDKQFTKVPRGSGIQQFLSQPNRFGWDVKRKLVWMGQHSYLFRHCFWNYIGAHGGRPDIRTIDDFICQETTAWSGLGVIDILAAVQDISAKQRATLRTWYERHLAYYHILSITKSHLKVKNLINDQLYQVRMENPGAAFKMGQFVAGSLVPWDEDWYWSGEQSAYDDLPAKAIQEIKQTFFGKMPAVAYRYCKQQVEVAREAVERHYRGFVEYHGSDLAVYPDGLSMAAGMQKLYRLYNEARLAEMPAEMRAKHSLPPTTLDLPYPPELIERKDGIGAYFHAGEGPEIMTGFNEVVSGLKKRGHGVTEVEAEAIHSIMTSDVISPDFVQRLVGDYGAESIAAVFLISDRSDKTYLPYLLRRYKGHFFRNRYPQIALVQDPSSR
jgi:hypothetical protein